MKNTKLLQCMEHLIKLRDHHIISWIIYSVIMKLIHNIKNNRCNLISVVTEFIKTNPQTTEFLNHYNTETKTQQYLVNMLTQQGSWGWGEQCVSETSENSLMSHLLCTWRQ